MAEPKVHHYRVVPVYAYEWEARMITSQAALNCCRCGTTIDNTGGPSQNSLCAECGKPPKFLPHPDPSRFPRGG